MCYHRTYLNTQLSRFSVVCDHLILATHPPDLYPVSGKRIAPMRAADRVILRDFNITTRIVVSSVAKVLTPHPPGG
jgi:hypothetical protein